LFGDSDDVICRDWLGIAAREQRAVRDLARKRMQLVHCCTTQVLAVETSWPGSWAGG
jgi:hypothetical protein